MITAVQNITKAQCPCCKTELFIPESNKRTSILCANCKARFLASFAILKASKSHIEAATTQWEKTYQVYDLRLLVQGVDQSLRFSIPNKKDNLSLVAGDKLLLLHTQRLERLALVQNLNHQWVVPLIDTKTSLLGKKIVLVLGLAFLGGYGATVFSTSKFAPLIGLGLTTPITVYALKRMQELDCVEKDENIISRLTRDQRLFKHKELLLAKIANLEQKKQEQLDYQQSADELNSDLKDISGSEDYQTTVLKRKELAQKHELVLQRQISLYKRQLVGVEIALKASHLDESLPENALFDDMAELEGLERQQRDIEAQMNSLEFDD